MCDLALVLGLAGTAVSAMGSIQAGNAQAAAANYNAQVLEMNAKLSDRRARDAVMRGNAEEQQNRLETARFRANQIAGMAANGVDVSFGSPLETITSSATMAEMDALTIRANSRREAYDHEVEGVNQRADATLKRMEGKAAKQAGFLNAFSTVLTGAGQAYGKYSALKAGKT
jgi:hypothetical protein